MEGSRFSKIKTFCLVLLSLPFLFYACLPDSYSEEVKQEKTSPIIDVKNDRISIDVKDIDLSILLKEIEQKAGVRITMSKELIGKKVTTRFADLDIESALRNILGTNYVFVFVKDDKNQYKLKEVMAVGYFSSKPPPERMIKKEIAYGSGKENIGVVRDPLVGPRSFAIDDQGNIYILDNVNNRVQVFSSNMEYLSTIPLKGQGFADDIVIDRYGFIYIIDGHVNLYQYDRNGNMINKIRIDEGRWKARRAMHIINQNIYVNACDPKMCADYIIAKIINGVLTPPSFDDIRKPVEKGIYGLSGRRYKTKMEKSRIGELEVFDIKGDLFKKLLFNQDKLIGIEFLGEDGRGDFYLITSLRGKTNELIEEIHKFNSDGNYLGAIEVPEVGNHFWAIKSFDVGKDGRIYWFTRKNDRAKVFILSSENN